ncbi:MAG: DUF402 domain-containing protein [Acidobacteria bacterium]|nr:MAG: DUF402 domain-containing protein [Acidobacteriota bacterium]REK01407.1 MAG: DUF402 domain-containing protein [Acidobacteriota bacterium]REK14363.1 MAG: DUF402 domain-containing protein [Acidobacteriota bacterium]REK45078.1 MAG: DUF402 domain-containing protein [Acidobacteriota bacterium]
MINKEIIVNSRKFDFGIHRTWKGRLAATEESLILVLGRFESEVRHEKLGIIRPGTFSYEYYWLDRWYSVFRFHEPDGAFRNFYCNVNQPPVLNDTGELDYVDLDIDILVTEDFSYEILDLDEFESNSRRYSYPEQTVFKAEDALKELELMIINREFPFNDNSALQPPPKASISCEA